MSRPYSEMRLVVSKTIIYSYTCLKLWSLVIFIQNFDVYQFCGGSLLFKDLVLRVVTRNNCETVKRHTLSIQLSFNSNFTLQGKESNIQTRQKKRCLVVIIVSKVKACTKKNLKKLETKAHNLCNKSCSSQSCS